MAKSQTCSPTVTINSPKQWMSIVACIWRSMVSDGTRGQIDHCQKWKEMSGFMPLLYEVWWNWDRDILMKLMNESNTPDTGVHGSSGSRSHDLVVGNPSRYGCIRGDSRFDRQSGWHSQRILTNAHTTRGLSQAVSSASLHSNLGVDYIPQCSVYLKSRRSCEIWSPGHYSHWRLKYTCWL